MKDVVNVLIVLFFIPILTFGQCLTASSEKIQLTIEKKDWQLNKKDKSLFQNISNVFSVKPIFFYFDDSNTAKGNAVAIPNHINIPEYNVNEKNINGYIGIGRNLKDRLEKKGIDGKAFGLLPLMYVLAHEHAHILQQTAKIRSLNLKPEVLELNADFAAGLYIGLLLDNFYEQMKNQVKNKSTEDISRKFKTYKILEKDALEIVNQTVLEFGDRKYFQPGHHGTSAERTKAFLNGYDHYFNVKNKYKDANQLIFKSVYNDLVSELEKHNALLKSWGLPAN